MKTILAALVFLSVCIAPVGNTIRAAQLEGGEEYTLRSGTTVEDDLYAGGGTVTIEGTVTGDLLVGGGNVFFSGSVAEDAALGGGNVQITGTVAEDLRVGGGNVIMSGSTGGDLVATGGNVHITSSAVINGDIIGAGGRILIEGRVNGDAQLFGGDIEINGAIQGPVTVTAGQRVRLGPEARLGSDLSYRAPSEFERAEEAEVSGSISFEPSIRPEREAAGFLTFWWIAKLLMTLATAGVLYLLFRRRVRSTVEEGISRFGSSILFGFIGLVVTPIAIIILFVSIIGIPLGILVGLMYMIWLVLGWATAGIIFGSLIFSWIFRTYPLRVDLLTILVGVLAIEALMLIPFIGWFAAFVLWLMALGSIGSRSYSRYWLTR